MSLHEALQLDATAQAALIRGGQISSAELVEASIAAADRVNPQINAIIHPRYDAARREAAAAAGEGALAGVPMVVKDLGCAIGGEPHHLGTRALKAAGNRAVHDSFLYRRFRAAGLITIGRTNTPEWGSTITTEPLSYGPSRNPWNLDHSTGGSSGGSAAAVAAGVVAVGHANDGGGSIRVPASECGLVGLKPTRARVSQGPDLGEGWAGYTIDGCVTRSVRDTAAVLDAICGPEVGDPYIAPPLPRALVDEVGAPAERLRIGVLASSPNAPTHPDCVNAVEATARLLESLGHHVEVASPAMMHDEGMIGRFITVIAAYAAADKRMLELMLGRPMGEADLEPDNLMYAGLGEAVTAADYIHALQGSQAWSRQMLSWWRGDEAAHGVAGSAGFDLLLTPTIGGPPPPIGYLSGPEGAGRVTELLQFTAQFNVTGQPAISLPLAVSETGLPIGVQLVAAHFREDLLVRVAAQIEAATPWQQLAPS
jgi:amidase